MFYEIVIVAILALLFHELYWKRRNLPPGPTPIPLIGNVVSLIWNPPGYDAYQRWKDQYGKVYTYWLGPTPVITINDFDLMQETFVADGENYADRQTFNDAFSREYREGAYGLIDTSGPFWREQRRFALHKLRDLGLGKKEMQERILLEAQCLMDIMEEDTIKEGATAPIGYLDRTVCSVINVVLFGYRFDETNIDEFHHVRRLLDEQIKQLSNPVVFFLFFSKFLRNSIPWAKKKYDLMMDVRDALYTFFRKNIEAHKLHIDYESEESGDFCEAYLKEIRKNAGEQDPSFTEKQLENVCLDLWVAGMETTAATMSWGVLQMVHHPEVQAKLHEEFDRVIKTPRMITNDDKNKLPYTCAVVNEIQRWANVLPQNLMRKTTNEVFIDGHRIPAGSPISPQISMLLYDPVIFPNPTEFNPSRFIAEDGSLIINRYLLPFSLGRRQCPGEGFARMELFLFFANLTHRFNILPEDPLNLPSLKRTTKTGTKPIVFKCVLKRRSE